ncbi:hypothetical protein F1516_08495 [Klebsiella michiganensis]|nr:hypothetical protein [Klebsiella michiganensis]MBG2570902.1 hypothetical protein [Klebsiella sp. LTGPAF-6F]MBD0962995.1 hypothetical protein [Klebsiella michiganensis]MBG2626615.1 hypothetical protein [Klebsiella michiganensis]MBG2699313.1 hypothetical protein [Klebsiella michiganensis]
MKYADRHCPVGALSQARAEISSSDALRVSMPKQNRISAQSAASRLDDKAPNRVIVSLILRHGLHPGVYSEVNLIAPPLR